MTTSSGELVFEEDFKPAFRLWLFELPIRLALLVLVFLLIATLRSRAVD